jgi:transposase
MLEVTDVHVLRHKVLVEGLSQREVARQLGVSRRTIKRYLRDDVQPGVRKEEGPRPRPVQDAICSQVFDLLATARTTRKQKLTAPVVREQLLAAGFDASERSVRRVMREWRRRRTEVFVPLQYAAGDLAEVDFFEVRVVLDGQETKAWMFVMRLMYSGRDFAWLYRWTDSACFLDGHVRAFAHFGAVPARILYDNLKPAVRRILVGSERDLNERFATLAAHYAFDPRFARPATGHDKGGVESRGKAIRWQHLTPVPEGRSLTDISGMLLARLDRHMDRPRRRGGETIAALWEHERARMLPLPLCDHDPSEVVPCGVDRQAKIRVKTVWYSVPSTWRGLQVRARLYADKVVVVHDGQRVEHARQLGNGQSIDYRHYLPELARKPQAIEQVADTLVAQLGDPFDRVWRQFVAQRGRREAARGFKNVLQAILDRGAEAAAGAIRRALEAGEDTMLGLRQPAAVSRSGVVPTALLQHQIQTSSLGVYDRLSGGAP